MPTTDLIMLIVLCLLGGGLLLAYFFLGSTRSYLLYLGVAFIISGLSLLVPSPWRYLVIPLALSAIILAIRESIRDTRERFRRFREEQHDREAAFAEMLKAQTRGPQKPGSDDTTAKP